MEPKTEREANRAIFYHRDSGGQHEQTPGQYVNWVLRETARLKLQFDGRPEVIEEMIRTRESVRGDIFLDFVVKGNLLSRRALDAMMERIERDASISHVFMPRRDRLARPDDPTEGDKLEARIRYLGVWIHYMDKVVHPLEVGARRDLGDRITSMVDFDKAGKERRDLAGKIIPAQINLARQGFSAGGRPPFFLRRWLMDSAVNPVRELKEGEVIRQRGFHVAWLPGPREVIELALRICELLRTLSASEIARLLTAEGIPSPGAGRYRTKDGIRYKVRPEWHANTVSAVGRSSYLLAQVVYGRRSMGDQLRFSANGPRELTASDYRDKERQLPKIVMNPESELVVANAKFQPLIETERHRELVTVLNVRGASQRGRPRSRNPDQNPMGGRIFDMDCCWLMYRVPHGKSFRYRCGAYMQSHGKRCNHNQVDGPKITAFALAAIRQRTFSKQTQQLIRAKLAELAREEERSQGKTDHSKQLANALLETERELELVQRNLARAASDEVFTAISNEFSRLKRKESELKDGIAAAQNAKNATKSWAAEVEECMGLVSSLQDLAQSGNSFAESRELFQGLNLRLFLKFQREYTGKERRDGPEFVNRVVSGEITLGDHPAPIEVYSERTDRKQFDTCCSDDSGATPPPHTSEKAFFSEKEGDPLGNVSRGDRI
jgi:hypothetical protein